MERNVLVEVIEVKLEELAMIGAHKYCSESGNACKYCPQFGILLRDAFIVCERTLERHTHNPCVRIFHLVDFWVIGHVI